MSNFDPNAVLRGAQLTLVGANRALQNPSIFRNDHYRQVAIAIVVGLVIQLIVSIPMIMVRVSFWFLSIFTDLENVTWDDTVIDALRFLQHSVLQVPFFLMTMMKRLSPALDNMFMESLDWVDRTYIQKHKTDDPTHLRAMYYPNLKLYDAHSSHKSSKGELKLLDRLKPFFRRYGTKAAISISVYLLSFMPFVGKFVLPAASYYTLDKKIGSKPALVIFASGLFVPRRIFIRFLQTYFASRSMMRELLEPYFSRVKFTPQQKRKWFFDREGVLFGFGVAFFVMIKVPIVGVVVYGIAEASTAYLITKITDPPPPPSEAEEFAESQVVWKNKMKFLSMPLSNLDALNAVTSIKVESPLAKEMPTKQFT